MRSTAPSKLAELQDELGKVEAAAERDWQRRTSGVPDRFLAQLRAEHTAKWDQALDLLRREIAKLSPKA